MRKLSIITVLCVLLLCAHLTAPKITAAQEPLVFWIHPYLPATELIKRFTPLARYLEDKLSRPVTIKIEKSYQAHINRVGNDEFDIAFMGPSSYVNMSGAYGKKPLLARLVVRGKPVFFGMIIVRTDSPINNLKDLRGKSFAFGDPNSTMSHLVPRYMLKKAGVGLNDLKKYEFLHTHHNVALGVLGGYYDAGGVKEEVFRQYRERGLRMLAKSPPISEHPFVARTTLPTTLVEALRKAFLELNGNDRGPAVLTSIKKSVTGIAPARNEDYDTLRSVMRIGTKPGTSK